MGHRIRAGFAQFDVRFGDWAANAAVVRRLCAEAEDADLLVFPELAFSGYNFQNRDEAIAHAEPFRTGPSSQLIRELAASHGTTLVAGYAERSDYGAYNACLLATPSGGLYNYRKIHLFDREKDCFVRGEMPPPVIETPAGRIGLMICFDWFFPETARLLALGGAQLIAHPSNLVLPWCQRAMFARCVENRVFAITANRIGTEDRAGRSLTFTGASQLLDTIGETRVSAPVDAEAVATAALDPSDADSKRLNAHNDLFNDRRRSLYGGLLGRDLD